MENHATLLPASEHASSLPKTNKHNNNSDNTGTSHNLKRLSLSTATATPLPDSSPIALHVGKPNNLELASSSNADQSLRSQLRKTPSSSSLGKNERSITPTLHKRTSLSSLQGVGGITPPRSPAFRRTSSNLASPQAGMAPRTLLSPAPEEPAEPPVTAAAVAQSFFRRELEAHHGASKTSQDHETVVILQDNCYSHRYSRPRTSKATLSTIVERPERIHASILGLATAYVRLGGRHAEGTAAPHPKKQMDQLSSIPFRFHRTTRNLPLTSPAATAIHGTKWMSELSIMCDSAEKNLALNGKELIRPSAQAASNGNSNTVQPKLHEGDLYLCSGSLSALEGALGGVCEGVDAAFAERGTKRAFVCIRPPGHHCSADYPSGFCWLNNVHVGISHASLTHGLTHAAIIDFDLHHGDGSQSITWAHNSRVTSLPKNAPHSKKTAIGYFSLHDINSYPCELGEVEKVQNASLCLENAHGQTIWNVHLQPWKTESEFWELYENRYMILISKARAFLRSHTERLKSAPNHPQPKAVIFLSAGFDASEWESPGMQRHQLNVPTDFYARFTRDVVQLAEEEDLGVDGRVISILEGGYSDRALMSGVLSHLSGLAATSKPTTEVKANNGLAHEMGRRLGRLDQNSDDTQQGLQPRGTSNEMFDSRWWALPRLEEFENLVNPPAPAAAARKPRIATPPTYSSTTQSYTAKIVASPQGRRSFSGSGTHIHPSTPSSVRPISPPPPAVDWMTAAHELSKLLIPSDRQTRSCKPEELNAEASRARRERHSIIGLPVEMPVPDSKRMQLRDRKSKPKCESDDEERPMSRTSRRQTIANVSTLGQDQIASNTTAQKVAEQVTRQPRRRLSVASSVGSERTSELSLGSSIDPLSQPNSLVVKKSRTPSIPRSEAAKARAVRKPPSVPRVSSGYSAASKPQAVRTAAHPVPPDQIPLSGNGDFKTEAVDHLTSGMKKMSIKLNVPSKEEQAAREAKAKPVARSRPKAAAPRTKQVPEANKVKEVNKHAESSKTPSPTSIKTDTVVSAEVPAQTAGSQTSAAEFTGTSDLLLRNSSPTSAIDLATMQCPPIQPRKNLVTQEAQISPQPPTPSFLAPTVSSILAYHAPVGIESAFSNPTSPTPKDISLGVSSSVPIVKSSQTNEVAPKHLSGAPKSPPAAVVSPPSTPKRTKENLPVFTSTSPIIFGKPTFPNPSIDAAFKISKDGGRACFPPQNTNPTVQGSNEQKQNDNNPLPPSANRGGEQSKEQGGGPVEDIWTVPDTPQMLNRKD